MAGQTVLDQIQRDSPVQYALIVTLWLLLTYHMAKGICRALLGRVDEVTDTELTRLRALDRLVKREAKDRSCAKKS